MSLLLKDKIVVRDLSVFYGCKQALSQLTLAIPERAVTAVIGPSGCGKTTFLRCLNRMNDMVPSYRMQGNIFLDGSNIYHNSIDVTVLRTRLGMVFQRPNPFPRSVYDNIAYGPRLQSLTSCKSELDDLVECMLRRVGLWKEIKEQLSESAMLLSGGQQQRLCIARALAVGPEILLMDEPCSALDPTATRRIEDLITELADDHGIIIITHSMAQAARISHKTAFIHMGKLVEYGTTDQIFNKPQNPYTLDYIKGRFG